jgi:Nif-specific regulatory protein
LRRHLLPVEGCLLAGDSLVSLRPHLPDLWEEGAQMGAADLLLVCGSLLALQRSLERAGLRLQWWRRDRLLLAPASCGGVSGERWLWVGDVPLLELDEGDAATLSGTRRELGALLWELIEEAERRGRKESPALEGVRRAALVLAEGGDATSLLFSGGDVDWSGYWRTALGLEIAGIWDLVPREVEERLQGILSRVMQGQECMLRFSGEREWCSRLVGVLAREAVRNGFVGLELSVGCDPGAPFSGILRQALLQLPLEGRFFPDLGSIFAGEDGAELGSDPLWEELAERCWQLVWQWVARSSGGESTPSVLLVLRGGGVAPHLVGPLLRALACRIQGAPWLVVLAGDSWPGEALSAVEWGEVAPGPLAVEDLTEWLISLSASPEDGARLAGWLAGRATHPGEAEVLLRDLAARGHLSACLEGWRIDALGLLEQQWETAAAGSVAGPAPEGEVLEVLGAGALIGPEFSTEFVAKLLGRPAPQVRPLLKRGVQLGWLREVVVSGRRAFRFVSPGHQARAYGEQSPERARGLHQRAAGELLGVKDMTPDLVMIIAEHWRRAGAISPAVRTLSEGAERCFRQGHLRDALGLVNQLRLLPLEDAASRRAAWGVNRLLAEILLRMGRLEECRRVLEESLGEGDEGSSGAPVWCIQFLGLVEVLAGDCAAAERWFVPLAVEQARTRQWGPEPVVLIGLALLAVRRGNLVAAERYLEQALSAPKVANYWRVQAHLLRAVLELRACRFSRRGARWRSARAAAIRGGDAAAQAATLLAEARYQAIWGDADRARQMLGLVRRLSRSHGLAGTEAEALAVDGRLSLRRGKWKRALERYAEAAEAFEELGFRERARRCRLDLAALFRRRGEHARALGALRDLGHGPEEELDLRTRYLLGPGGGSSRALSAAALGRILRRRRLCGVKGDELAVGLWSIVAAETPHLSAARRRELVAELEQMERLRNPAVTPFPERLVIALAGLSAPEEALDWCRRLGVVQDSLRCGEHIHLAARASLVLGRLLEGLREEAEEDSELIGSGELQGFLNRMAWGVARLREMGAEEECAELECLLERWHRQLLPAVISLPKDRRRLELLVRITGLLNSAHRPEDVLDSILVEVGRAMGARQAALLLRLDPRGPFLLRSRVGEGRISQRALQRLVRGSLESVESADPVVLADPESLEEGVAGVFRRLLPLVITPILEWGTLLGALVLWEFEGVLSRAEVGDGFLATVAKQLLLAAGRWRQSRALRAENRILSLQQRFAMASRSFVGTSPAMQRVYELIDRLKDSPSTVLILGESGTGKEMVARALHECGRRGEGPFVAYYCGAVARDLVEAELFGAVRGAYTGAVRDRRGLLEAASGGTFFLDEVADIPLETQAKLLRILQEGEIKPVGSTEIRKVDVRFVAATHRDLEAMVRSGKFREDLFYRLSVVRIEVPALRERREDIPLLAKHFLAKYNEKLGKEIVGFCDDVLRLFRTYHWPGNVRELENAVEAAVNMADSGERLEWRHLPTHIVKAVERDIWRGSGEGRLSAADLVRRQQVLDAMVDTGWVVSRAAEQLGMTRQGLSKLIKRLDIKPFEGR